MEGKAVRFPPRGVRRKDRVITASAKLFKREQVGLRLRGKHKSEMKFRKKITTIALEGMPDDSKI